MKSYTERLTVSDAEIKYLWKKEQRGQIELNERM